MILYSMLVGYLPFDDDPNNPNSDNIKKLYHYITHSPLQFPAHIQPTCSSLIEGLLHLSPQDRITLTQIKQHPWWIQHCEPHYIHQGIHQSIHQGGPSPSPEAFHTATVSVPIRFSWAKRFRLSLMNLLPRDRPEKTPSRGAAGMSTILTWC